MNRRAKGRKFELLTQTTLILQGWSVEVVHSPSKWQKQVDLFGLFDLVAIHPVHRYVLLIQCKAGKQWKYPSKAWKQAAQSFLKDNPIIKKQLWQYKDRIKLPRITDL